MRPLTLVLPYYENPDMLALQVAHWGSLPVDVQNNLSVIIVDDGSPHHTAERTLDKVRPWPAWAAISLYRIRVDVRWNWIACRNLAMHYARDDWRLMTDMDHVVPEGTLRAIMETDRLTDCAYRFARRDLLSFDKGTLGNMVTAPNKKSHPNTWLMTGDLFDKAGGYDERFSGLYGSDGEFRDRVARAARRVIDLPAYVIRVSRELVPDASTTTYTRKDPKLDKGRVARIRKDRGNSPTLRLTFPWERVF